MSNINAGRTKHMECGLDATITSMISTKNIQVLFEGDPPQKRISGFTLNQFNEGRLMHPGLDVPAEVTVEKEKTEKRGSYKGRQKFHGFWVYKRYTFIKPAESKKPDKSEDRAGGGLPPAEAQVQTFYLCRCSKCENKIDQETKKKMLNLRTAQDMIKHELYSCPYSPRRRGLEGCKIARVQN